MQNFYFQIKSKEERMQLERSFPLFVKTIPVRLRPYLRRIEGNRMIFTGTNKDFFACKIYHYWHGLLKDGKKEILNRVTTDVKFPKASDPLMLSGEYLKATKDLYSHVSGLPADTILRQVKAWCSVGRVFRGVNGVLFLDRQNEYEELVMKRFNEKGFSQAGMSEGLGPVTLLEDFV